MTDEDIRLSAENSINTLISENSYIILHYLAIQAMGTAVAKMGRESPIVGIDPINMSLMRELSRLNPSMSSRDLTELRIVVGTVLRDGNYADLYFERQDICERGKCSPFSNTVTANAPKS